MQLWFIQEGALIRQRCFDDVFVTSFFECEQYIATSIKTKYTFIIHNIINLVKKTTSKKYGFFEKINVENSVYNGSDERMEF